MIYKEKAKCPVCGFISSTSRYGAKREFQEKEIKHHMTVKAKNELWASEFDKDIKTPHLDFIRKNLKKTTKVIISYNL